MAGFNKEVATFLQSTFTWAKFLFYPGKAVGTFQEHSIQDQLCGFPLRATS
jgi:hypothetical protein